MVQELVASGGATVGEDLGYEAAQSEHHQTRSGQDWIGTAVAVNSIFATGISLGSEVKPRYWGTTDFKLASKTGQSIARKLSFIGASVAVYQAIDNPTGGNIVDATFGVIGAIPHPITMGIGGIYFGADLLTLGISGQGISEHIDDYYWMSNPVVGIGYVPVAKKVK
ncbi:hypothetical protein C900_00217 [Fulvivirga imtechensis AK7]|uniref:Uncharacterized protein n=1 Tax=Fulvivirga imtechensis AK7 TaxID=1237149 RepID=L8JI98_9BACT|nr:hypothetical protein C900_00217 [Fulvivirga imtechensis AK7]